MILSVDPSWISLVNRSGRRHFSETAGADLCPSSLLDICSQVVK